MNTLKAIHNILRVLFVKKIKRNRVVTQVPRVSGERGRCRGIRGIKAISNGQSTGEDTQHNGSFDRLGAAEIKSRDASQLGG